MHKKKMDRQNPHFDHKVAQLLRQNYMLMEDLKQMGLRNAMVDVMISCSARYQELNGPAKDDLYEKLASSDANHSIRKKIDYFDSYWQLQLEQYYWYCEGLIMKTIFEYWLHCRIKDWNIAEIVRRELIEQRKAETDTKKKAEMDDEQRAADNEQRLYRSGWTRAKKYLPDKEFVHKMDDVMQETKPSSIQNMLDSTKH